MEQFVCEFEFSFLRQSHLIELGNIGISLLYPQPYPHAAHARHKTRLVGHDAEQTQFKTKMGPVTPDPSALLALCPPA